MLFHVLLQTFFNLSCANFLENGALGERYEGFFEGGGVFYVGGGLGAVDLAH